MLEHGGRLRLAARHYGIPLADWLDLSTGINPHAWPVPPLAPEVWQRLPESDDGLEAAAAAYYGNAQLLPVAGSQAAIQALPTCFAPGRVLTLAPTYAEHPHAWREHHVTALPAARIAGAVGGADTLLLVQPNNPTGERFSREQLLDWHRDLASRGGRLIVDEAFLDVTGSRALHGDAETIARAIRSAIRWIRGGSSSVWVMPPSLPARSDDGEQAESGARRSAAPPPTAARSASAPSIPVA